MKGSIDTEKLNIQAVPGFIEPLVAEATTYDFDIIPSMEAGGTTPILGKLRDIELELRDDVSTGRVFGAQIFPETFEGEGLAIAAVAGAIIVVVLVAGGAYLTFQAQKAMELTGAVLAPGISIAESVAEAVAPEEAVKDPSD